jgi:hypothetical protein
MHYSNAPGKTGNTPIEWPKNLGINFSTEKPTLAMMVHPRCACSKSSLNELERLVSRFPNAFDTHIFFYEPNNEQSWKDSELWIQAKRIQGVKLSQDGDGKMARLFDSYTSGHIVLYDTKGSLLFSGGITSSRGHEGLSTGREEIENYIRNSAIPQSQTPVFGCDLFEEQNVS